MRSHPSLTISHIIAVQIIRRRFILAICVAIICLLLPGVILSAQRSAPDNPMTLQHTLPQESSPISSTTLSAVDPTMPNAVFLHVARTGVNIASYITTIDHPATNNNASALVFVTPNWNPGNVGGTYNNRAVGVWYDGGKWKIFNQNIEPMPDNAAFNVMVYPSTAPNVFIHQATESNIVNNHTCINSPLTNNKPNALLFITPNYSAGSLYNQHPTNVFYVSGFWCIGNQNGEPMPVSIAFNVLALDASASAFVHQAATPVLQQTAIDNPLTNNNPFRYVFITQNFNPGGSSGVYNPNHVGIYYSDGKMRIFNQNIASMPVNAAFNVFVPVSQAAAFVHVANASNIEENYTSINQSLINYNRLAMIFVTPNWNPGGSAGVYNDHPIGVFYDTLTNQWAIFNQNLATMPNNAAFNVLAPEPGINVFLQKVTSANKYVDHVTVIDHPLTNNNPNAKLLVTPNWNPVNPGVYNNANIGVAYSSTLSKWYIFNQGVETMPLDASFNVMVLPSTPEAFIHTATGANTAANVTTIDNPATNGKRGMLVFITSNYNPGGASTGIDNNRATGVYWFDNRWRIFNQNPLSSMPTNASFNVYVASNTVFIPSVQR